MEFEKQFEEAKKFFAKEKFIVSDDDLRAVLAAKEEGIPVLAVGPTGSGKTEFFSIYSKFLKGNYHYQSLNGSLTVDDLTQELRLEKDGTFAERDMVIAEWLRDSQNKVSVLQLDEVNAAKPETLLSIHSIMDLKKLIQLKYSREVLKVNSNSVLVMSCNEGDEYAGINAMNMAFQNRYIKIHFKYLVGDELANLLTTKTQVPLEQTSKIVETWSKYMSSRQPEEPVVSIRMLEYWCNLSKYLGLKQAGKYTFANLIAETEDNVDEILEGDFFINLE